MRTGAETLSDETILEAVAAEAADETPQTTATTDARHFIRNGIPAVCFGPRGEQIHGIDERVSLRSVVESAQVLGLFVRDWCGLVPGRKEES